MPLSPLSMRLREGLDINSGGGVWGYPVVVTWSWGQWGGEGDHT